MYEYSQLDSALNDIDPTKKVDIKVGDAKLAAHAGIDPEALGTIIEAVKARAGPDPMGGEKKGESCDCQDPYAEAAAKAAQEVERANERNGEAQKLLESQHKKALDEIKASTVKAAALQQKVEASGKAVADAEASLNAQAKEADSKI